MKIQGLLPAETSTVRAHKISRGGVMIEIQRGPFQGSMGELLHELMAINAAGENSILASEHRFIDTSAWEARFIASGKYSGSSTSWLRFRLGRASSTRLPRGEGPG
jgi:hypothetical protein